MFFVSLFRRTNLWSIVSTPKMDFIDDLPDDILHKIFNKLPIKSIGRCMRVQKRWHTLLKSPSFLSVYNNTKREKSKYLIILKTDYQLQVYLDNYNMDYSKLYTFPPLNKLYYFADENCIAICNGLICFARDPSNFVLWNPFIKKTLALPETILMPNRPPIYLQHIGFAFDPITNDYKVIRIVEYRRGMKSDVQVFSLNHISWKFSCQIDDKYHFGEQSPPSTNGSLFLLVSERCVNATFITLVLEFNLNTESFQRIKLPDKIGARTTKNYKKLVVDKDSQLVLVTIHFDEFGDIDIWVLKDHCNADSWTNIWKFKNIHWSGFYCLTNLRILADRWGFVEDARKSWFQKFSEPHDETISEITTERALNCVNVRNLVIRHVFRPFEESLMLLDM